MKIVLDMDPGIDDAIALLLALNNPELDVLAVTTVSGNVSLRKATTNALRIIEASGKGTPVYMGSSRPLRRRPVHAEGIHGNDGLGNCGLARPRLKPETGAVNMLVQLIKTHKRKEISLVATAPLTNIATLFQREPSLARKLRIFVMGGIYDMRAKGNVSEHAEFNFYSDPEAAEMVMRSAGVDIVASGLEATSDPRCAARNGTLAAMRSIKGKAAELACRILAYPVQKYGYFNLHDVFSLFSLLYPEIFKTGKCSVRVDCSREFRGKCMVTSGGNVVACKKVDHIKFNEYMLDGLRSS